MSKRRSNDEFDLQCAVVRILHRAALPNLIFYAIPNGEKRDPVVGAKLRMMGVRPGVADLAFVVSGRAYFLELKAPGGYPSGEQIAFAALCERNGTAYQVASSLEEAIEFLTDIGAIRHVTVS